MLLHNAGELEALTVESNSEVIYGRIMLIVQF